MCEEVLKMDELDEFERLEAESQDDVYEEEIEDLMENDEISAEEAGFMKGSNM
jgi:hypothetical protein